MGKFMLHFGIGLGMIFGMLQLSSSLAVGQIDVSLPTDTGQVGDTPLLPITVGDVTGQGVVAYQFTVSYDSTILTITGIDASGTLSEGMSIVPNSAVSGQITVAAAGATPLSGSGTLLNLHAEYVGEGTSPLTWTDFVFNEGDPAANATNGSVEIIGLMGDFNGDNVVDVSDLVLFAAHFGSSSGDPGYDPIYDLTGDLTVDVSDLVIFASVFGTEGPAPPGPFFRHKR